MICGYILAGGKNSRMNGNKKLFLEYEGELFYDRILEVFDMFDETYISVECDEPYRQLDVPLVVDQYKEIGPMGGIVSGLSQIDAEALCVAACDMPMVEKNVIKQLVKAYEEHPVITVIQAGERLHPLLGIYPRKCLPIAKDLIEAGYYKMRGLLEQFGYQVVVVEEDAPSIYNVNTMEEYQKLKQLKNHH